MTPEPGGAAVGQGKEPDPDGAGKKLEKHTEGLLDRLFGAMQNAVDLRIVTVIGDFEIGGFDDPKEAMQVKIKAETKGLFTSINLATGDIRCVMSREYSGAQNKDVQNFHAKQVELARDVVASNLRVMGDLAEKFGGFLQRQLGQGT
jgi:hypothetical protein